MVCMSNSDILGRLDAALAKRRAADPAKSYTASLYAGGTAAISGKITEEAAEVLLRVEQVGGVACHTGRESCFFQVYDNGRWVTRDPVIVDPKDMYGLHE